MPFSPASLLVLNATDGRSRILLAARQCFARRGFDLTSMGDIQAAAAMSRGAIYHHFRSKEEIIQFITTENSCRMSEMVAEILVAARSEQLSLMEALERLCSFVQQIILGPGQAMGLRVWAAATVNKEIHSTLVEAFERIRSLMTELIRSYQMRGEISPQADAEELGAVMFAVTIPGFEVQRLFLDSRSLDPKAFAKGLHAMFAANSTARPS